jgi:molybdopterin synthase catalytic subunit
VGRPSRHAPEQIPSSAPVTIVRVPVDTGRASGDTWVELTPDELSITQMSEWVVLPDSGAYVVFGGTVRDHSAGRSDVSELQYEAYASQVEPRLAAIADEARVKWPGVRRIAIHHRIGTLRLREASVMVAVSSGHRGEAFDAAEYCIDTLKATVPIWKRERWRDGEDWAIDAHEITEVGG